MFLWLGHVFHLVIYCVCPDASSLNIKVHQTILIVEKLLKLFFPVKCPSFNCEDSLLLCDEVDIFELWVGQHMYEGIILGFRKLRNFVFTVFCHFTELTIN